MIPLPFSHKQIVHIEQIVHICIYIYPILSFLLFPLHRHSTVWSPLQLESKWSGNAFGCLLLWLYDNIATSRYVGWEFWWQSRGRLQLLASRYIDSFNTFGRIMEYVGCMGDPICHRFSNREYWVYQAIRLSFYRDVYIILGCSLPLLSQLGLQMVSAGWKGQICSRSNGWHLWYRDHLAHLWCHSWKYGLGLGLLYCGCIRGHCMCRLVCHSRR